MAIKLKQLLLAFSLFMVSTVALAKDPPPPPNRGPLPVGVPITDGILILLAGGVYYGIKKIRKEGK